MNKGNFYSNKANGTDGFNPYCKTCTKHKSSKWVKDNAETHRGYKRTERAKEVSRLTKRKNDQKYRGGKSYQQWIKTNKSRLKEYREKRKSKKHDISQSEWRKCKEYFNNCCAYCGMPESDHFRKWKNEYKKSDFHKEHFDDTGVNDLSNCVPSCLNCNSSKWIHDFEKWYPQQPFFSDERLAKIKVWLEQDYRLYIKEMKE
ncbi:HNH endonuclease [Paenibacillus sp. EKM202P]|uniref:HNH endonuclease signature motif containing protein n=1 Tax=unclassified Paenibacillus TaxID=185978 RepID=UPI0013ED53FE|nr:MULTISPECIES: HNH endonuclease signature motif containing protein [unclassified Paenibacillus]KAF6565308.1 HNH endonuclease [Paenibacillus sp. EKM202P]KAF6569366.1 HNH endonuclease [Paenibacillus sp. EKM207P]